MKIKTKNTNQIETKRNESKWMNETALKPEPSPIPALYAYIVFVQFQPPKKLIYWKWLLHISTLVTLRIRTLVAIPVYLSSSSSSSYHFFTLCFSLRACTRLLISFIFLLLCVFLNNTEIRVVLHFAIFSFGSLVKTLALVRFAMYLLLFVQLFASCFSCGSYSNAVYGIPLSWCCSLLFVFILYLSHSGHFRFGDNFF